MEVLRLLFYFGQAIFAAYAADTSRWYSISFLVFHYLMSTVNGRHPPHPPPLPLPPWVHYFNYVLGACALTEIVGSHDMRTLKPLSVISSPRSPSHPRLIHPLDPITVCLISGQRRRKRRRGSEKLPPTAMSLQWVGRLTKLVVWVGGGGGGRG